MVEDLQVRELEMLVSVSEKDISVIPQVSVESAPIEAIDHDMHM